MAKTATRNNVLIETNSINGVYDMSCTKAIINHHEHGRLMISEGFGGQDSLEGGMYRWKHGAAYKVGVDETISSLYQYDDAGYMNLEMYDRIDLSGKTIQQIAKSVGL